MPAVAEDNDESAEAATPTPVADNEGGEEEVEVDARERKVADSDADSSTSHLEVDTEVDEAETPGRVLSSRVLMPGQAMFAPLEATLCGLVRITPMLNFRKPDQRTPRAQAQNDDEQREETPGSSGRRSSTSSFGFEHKQQRNYDWSESIDLVAAQGKLSEEEVWETIAADAKKDDNLKRNSTVQLISRLLNQRFGVVQTHGAAEEPPILSNGSEAAIILSSRLQPGRDEGLSRHMYTAHKFMCTAHIATAQSGWRKNAAWRKAAEAAAKKAEKEGTSSLQSDTAAVKPNNLENDTYTTVITFMPSLCVENLLPLPAQARIIPQPLPSATLSQVEQYLRWERELQGGTEQEALSKMCLNKPLLETLLPPGGFQVVCFFEDYSLLGKFEPPGGWEAAGRRSKWTASKKAALFSKVEETRTSVGLSLRLPTRRYGKLGWSPVPEGKAGFVFGRDASCSEVFLGEQFCGSRSGYRPVRIIVDRSFFGNSTLINTGGGTGGGVMATTTDLSNKTAWLRRLEGFSVHVRLYTQYWMINRSDLSLSLKPDDKLGQRIIGVGELPEELAEADDTAPHDAIEEGWVHVPGNQVATKKQEVFGEWVERADDFGFMKGEPLPGVDVQLWSFDASTEFGEGRVLLHNADDENCSWEKVGVEQIGQRGEIVMKQHKVYRPTVRDHRGNLVHPDAEMEVAPSSPLAAASGSRGWSHNVPENQLAICGEDPEAAATQLPAELLRRRKAADLSSEICLGVAIDAAPGKFFRSKVVTVSPHMLVVNKSGFDIQFRQTETDELTTPCTPIMSLPRRRRTKQGEDHKPVFRAGTGSLIHGNITAGVHEVNGFTWCAFHWPRSKDRKSLRARISESHPTLEGKPASTRPETKREEVVVMQEGGSAGDNEGTAPRGRFYKQWYKRPIEWEWSDEFALELGDFSIKMRKRLRGPAQEEPAVEADGSSRGTGSSASETVWLRVSVRKDGGTKIVTFMPHASAMPPEKVPIPFRIENACSLDVLSVRQDCMGAAAAEHVPAPGAPAVRLSTMMPAASTREGTASGNAPHLAIEALAAAAAKKAAESEDIMDCARVSRVFALDKPSVKKKQLQLHARPAGVANLFYWAGGRVGYEVRRQKWDAAAEQLISSALGGLEAGAYFHSSESHRVRWGMWGSNDGSASISCDEIGVTTEVHVGSNSGDGGCGAAGKRIILVEVQADASSGPTTVSTWLRCSSSRVALSYSLVCRLFAPLMFLARGGRPSNT